MMGGTALMGMGMGNPSGGGGVYGPAGGMGGGMGGMGMGGGGAPPMIGAMQTFGSGEAKQQLEVPKTIVGKIIGRGGETITMVQRKSGARVMVDQSVPEGMPCKVAITGTPQTVSAALMMLQEIMGSAREGPSLGFGVAGGNKFGGGAMGGGMGMGMGMGGGMGGMGQQYGGMGQQYGGGGAMGGMYGGGGGMGMGGMSMGMGGMHGAAAGGMPQQQGQYGAYGAYGGNPQQMQQQQYGMTSGGAGAGGYPQQQAYGAGAGAGMYQQMQQHQQQMGMGGMGMGMMGGAAGGGVKPMGVPAAAPAASAWQEHKTDEGVSYWYNTTTGVSQVALVVVH